MKTKRTYYKFFLNYEIKHESETDIWSIHNMPNMEQVAVAHSLKEARLKIFKELPIIKYK